MTSRTRCPHCSAALPLEAAWCSLCHADLRPAPEPAARFEPVPAYASAEPATTGSAATDSGPVALPPVRGRHRRTDAGEPPPAPATEPTSAPSVHVVPDDLPLGVDGKPDVEAAAARMLAQLAATDSSRGLPDVEKVPGGKWGLLFGGMAVVVVLCLIVATAAAAFLR